MLSTTKTRFAAVALAAFAGTAIAVPASASGGGGVSNEGACSASSSWTLKAKPENGGLEVEFEVDSNVVGQVWQVRLSDNGQVLFRGPQTTTGPSGSFSLEVRTADQSGPDKILGQARNPQTGETCVGRVTHP